MSCDTQTFSNVSPEQLEAIRAKASAAGLVLEGNSGEASTHGVRLDWSYDPATSTLTISCVGKPFFVSCDHVNQTIKELISEALNGGPQ